MENTTHDFKDGEIVRLRSGGPQMTVQNNRKDRVVCCYWFRDGELLNDAFQPEALERVSA
jgi:uncharacterized protein YodC (DUF2158 family)